MIKTALLMVTLACAGVASAQSRTLQTYDLFGQSSTLDPTRWTLRDSGAPGQARSIPAGSLQLRSARAGVYGVNFTPQTPTEVKATFFLHYLTPGRCTNADGSAAAELTLPLFSYGSAAPSSNNGAFDIIATIRAIRSTASPNVINVQYVLERCDGVDANCAQATRTLLGGGNFGTVSEQQMMTFDVAWNRAAKTVSFQRDALAAQTVVYADADNFPPGAQSKGLGINQVIPTCSTTETPATSRSGIWVDAIYVDQSGDECTNAIPIPTAGGTFTGTTTNLSDNLTPSCAPVGSAASKDAVYKLHLDYRTRMQFSTAGSAFDTIVSVYNYSQGSCTGTAIACNNDSSAAGGTNSFVDATLNPGDYYVFVDGNNGASGNYTLTATPILSETCSAAYALSTSNATYSGNTTANANDYAPTCGYTAAPPAGAPDEVYALHLDNAARVQLSTAGSAFDTILQVTSASGCPGTPVWGCNDDYGGQVTSFLDLTLPRGDYNVLVTGYGAAKGAFNLTATFLDNDVCGGAYVIPGTSGTYVFNGSTVGKGNNYTSTSASCSNTAGPDVVYKITPAASGTVTFQTGGAGTQFDTVVYVKNASACMGAELACNDDSNSATSGGSPTGRQSWVQAALTAGTSYYVVVDGYGSAAGAYQLTVTVP